MGRYLNVGLMQFEISTDREVNMEKIKTHVSTLMRGMKKPEMILGPEFALGLNARLTQEVLDTFSIYPIVVSQQNIHRISFHITLMKFIISRQ